MLMTAYSSTLRLRDLMVWMALIRLFSAITGSTDSSGIAPWPLAGDANADTLRRRHGWPGLDHAGAYRQAGHVVQGIHRIARKTLKQAIVEHGLGPGQAFFVRLENHIQRAIEIARGSQLRSGGQEDCGMPVMATGMHAPGDLAGMGKGVFSVMGKASMSARKPMLRGPLPTFNTPTTPCPPTLRWTS